MIVSHSNKSNVDDNDVIDVGGDDDGEGDDDVDVGGDDVNDDDLNLCYIV